MSNATTVTHNAVTNAVSNGTPSYPTRPDPARPGLQRWIFPKTKTPTSPFRARIGLGVNDG